MAKVLDDTGLSFDDVLLVPRRSTIGSRFNGDIDMSVELLPGLTLKYPVISANMDTCTGEVMTNKMNELGCLGIPHRFLKIRHHIEMLKEVNGNKVACIGVGEAGLERLKRIIIADPNIKNVLIDIAHGHSDVMINQIERIRVEFPDIGIIAGNVATYDGALGLLNAGAHAIKVGVGPGSLCSTRIQTGNGIPQLTAIIECRKAIDDFCNNNDTKFRPTLIADGGIRYSGDIVKSLAAGANSVMVGSLFAGTTEAPGPRTRSNNKLVKCYRGMASRAAQESWKGHATSIEGEMTFLDYKGDVEDIFNELLSGMLSGMSYQNAHSIEELQENATFIRQTPVGLLESKPHALFKGG